MFGDMLGNMEERQKELRKKLAEIIIEAEVNDGAVKVSANANREIINISIDEQALDWKDKEQLEDLVTVAVNRALKMAAEKEAAETKRLLQEMMPPGLGGLSGLFG